MPNKIYAIPETPIVFRDSGGDVTLTLQNLAFGAGRVSARHDRGTGAKPREYEVRAVIQFETSPIVGEVVELYLATSDGTYGDGTLGTSDAAIGSDKRRNLLLIGCVVADTTTAGTDLVATFRVEISSRYFSVGVWNASAGDNLKNTANTSRIIFTPVPDEIQ